MNPAWSVIFLTTLIGAGQGLFLALFGLQALAYADTTPQGLAFLLRGGVLALILCAVGLLASFFHLGRPERAWRAAAMWRTSWLSREVIVLPAFMGGVVCWLLALSWGHVGGSLWLGLGTAVVCLVLFLCTAMIYASIKFLQEWASPLTVVNYTLLGLASGFTLATSLAALLWPDAVWSLGVLAFIFTLSGLVTRSLSLMRNARLKPKSTLQTAIGIRHPKIVQRARGFMGGAFNLREFFHGAAPGTLKHVRWAFLVGAFVLPLVWLAWGLVTGHAGLLVLAFVTQYAGLLAERWFFFAQARHPQNLYYQAVS